MEQWNETVETHKFVGGNMRIGTVVRHCYHTTCGLGIIIEMDVDCDNDEPLHLVQFSNGLLEWYYDNGDLEVVCE